MTTPIRATLTAQIEEHTKAAAALQAQIDAMPPDPVRLRVKDGATGCFVYAGDDPNSSGYYVANFYTRHCERHGLDSAVEAKRYVDTYNAQTADPARARYLSAQPQYEALREAVHEYGLNRCTWVTLCEVSRALDAALNGGAGCESVNETCPIHGRKAADAAEETQ